MKSFLMRGVPASLQMDAWWMSETSQSQISPKTPMQTGRDIVHRPPVQIIMLLAMVLLADWLFWGYGAGVSLVLFAVAMMAGGWVASTRRITWRQGLTGGLAVIAGMLPVIIYVQAISLGFYLATLTGFSVWMVLSGNSKTADILRASLRFLMLVPTQLLQDAKPALGNFADGQAVKSIGHYLLRAWALPIVVGTVFLLLFIQGNPFFENLVAQLFDIDPSLERLGFWGLIAVMVWPFLVLGKMRQRVMLPFSPLQTGTLSAPALLNDQSVMNSLILFNLMFLLQTGFDVKYLWGGNLPDGMSYAAYAHRGAYPLVATALLAGLFALISRPYLNRRRGMRGLLFLWLVQNLILMVGAVTRLDLYVATYGLTYLRLAAFIWMGMVMAGLLLIGWQVLRDKSNGWLLARVSVLLAVVLYACSFVNFANVIAANNLWRSKLVQGYVQTDQGYIRTDAGYICGLGPMALPAITDFQHKTGQIVCPHSAAPQPPKTENWREWGFRKWQVQRYLATSPANKDVL